MLKPDANNHPNHHHLSAATLRYIDRPSDELRVLPAYVIFSGRAAYAEYRHQCTAWAKGVATDYEVR
ncbi:hypothetical protein [Tateyamaria sp.]|uniref:hypothetical protein n=1 Tax=Tateyamaria sp. TaxID=1929288 RepID=UPI0032A052CC